MSDKKKYDRDSPRNGSVVAQDDELVIWLHSLWNRGEPPERIEVWLACGPNKMDRGRLIYHNDVKPNSNWNAEQANHCANEIIASAQNDCDTSGTKNARYSIVIIDRNRKATPLERLIGPFFPSRRFLMGANGSSPTKGLDIEDDEMPLDIKSLLLAAIKEGNEQNRWGAQRNDRVLGDVITLLGNMVTQQQAYVMQTQSQIMSLNSQLQTAADMSLDRELRRDKEKFNMKMWESAFDTGKNFLYAAMPSLIDNGSNQQQLPQNPQQPQLCPFTPECAIVEKLLKECEESKLSIALFGDWEKQDGKAVLVKPGIFSQEQFAILFGVKIRRYPAEKLDELIPEFGHEAAIKEEQLMQARMLPGMTESIITALMMIYTMRMNRRSQQSNQTTNNQ